MNFHRELLLLKKIKQNQNKHDPTLDDYEILDNKYKRTFNFCRPTRLFLQKWNPIQSDWETIIVEESESYYRPSDFYDFYYSPNELDKMSNKKKEQFNDEYIINSKQQNLNTYRSLQFFIKKNKYRIVKFIPLPSKFLLKQYSLFDSKDQYFDETWNTINYFDFFIMKPKTYYMNIENLSCSCKSKKICNHLSKYVLRRIYYKYLNNITLAILFSEYSNNFFDIIEYSEC